MNADILECGGHDAAFEQGGNTTLLLTDPFSFYVCFDSAERHSATKIFIQNSALSASVK
jgi:hypothetical protein